MSCAAEEPAQKRPRTDNGPETIGETSAPAPVVAVVPAADTPQPAAAPVSLPPPVPSATEVTEEEVGIRCYLSDTPGFNGVLKHRFSDFLVYEVDPDGRVAKLTPELLAAAKDVIKADEPAEQLAKLVGETEAARFAAWVATDPTTTDRFEFPPESDKDRRSALHKAVKAASASFDSTTSDKKVVVIPLKKGQRPEKRIFWPRDRPPYLVFTMAKENMETSYAIGVIARKLGLRPNNLMCAGNKDKRGVTAQRVCAFHVDAARVASLNGRSGRLWLGDWAYTESPVLLGCLKGNRFEIALREVDADDAVLAAAATQLSERGFVNYFGLQRFGTGTVRTHEIGVALLRQDWKRAIELILAPHQASSAAAIKARELFAQGDIKGAMESFPSSYHIERSLLGGLLKCGASEYTQALECIPRTSRLLYLHAYQSFIWNTLASERIQKLGLEPVVGDLVYDGGDSDDNVRVLIASDLAGDRKWTLRDVAIPLPGSNVILPVNELEECARKLLRKDGMEHILDAQTKKKADFYTLRGTYRRLVERPEDLTWRIVPYTDVDEQIQPTVGEPNPQPVPGPRRALCVSFTLPSSCYATMCYRELLKQNSSKANQCVMMQRAHDPTASAANAEEADEVEMEAAAEDV